MRDKASWRHTGRNEILLRPQGIVRRSFNRGKSIVQVAGKLLGFPALVKAGGGGGVGGI